MYGVIGNPVGHSRSPALHNTAMHAAGMDAVYMPLLVDDLQPFLDAFPDFSGFSVTIPHKVSLPLDQSLLWQAITQACMRCPDGTVIAAVDSSEVLYSAICVELTARSLSCTGGGTGGSSAGGSGGEAHRGSQHLGASAGWHLESI